MAWAAGKTDPKYRTKQHRDYLANLKRQLAKHGVLECTARVCVFDTRAITNPNGRQPDGLTAGHADNGTDYDGPQHRQCNVDDGARRARAARRRRGNAQASTLDPNRWVL